MSGTGGRGTKARRWLTLGTERVYTTPIFDLHRRKSGHPNRGDRDFYVLEAPAWVNIIPLTARREVVMVRQFRHGISGFTLEIPGGMVDPEDRSPAVAARREMTEETGYDGDEIIALGKVHPNPSIQPNFCYSFFAPKVHHVTGPHANPDGSEETEVMLVPLARIGELIATGKISHALVIAAFAFFHVYNPPHGALRRTQSKPAPRVVASNTKRAR